MPDPFFGRMPRIQARFVTPGLFVVVIALAAVFLREVAMRAGAQPCEAVIHVPVSKVYLWVDDSAFWVNDWRDSPVAVQLQPGPHSIRLVHDGRVIYKEKFILKPNDQAVLTAWDENKMLDLIPKDAPSAPTTASPVPPSTADP